MHHACLYWLNATGTKDVGTYDETHTWFDVGVSTFTGSVNRPWKTLYRNLPPSPDITPSAEYETHTASWNLCTAKEYQQWWIRQIQSGDSIQLIPRAQYQTWANHVKSARIDLHCMMVCNIDAPISLNTVTIEDNTGTNESGRNQYQHYRK